MKETLTVTQLSAKMGVDYLTAHSLIKVMLAQGLTKATGKVNMLGKRGKPSSLYDIPSKVTFSLFTPGMANPVAKAVKAKVKKAKTAKAPKVVKVKIVEDEAPVAVTVTDLDKEPTPTAEVMHDELDRPEIKSYL